MRQYLGMLRPAMVALALVALFLPAAHAREVAQAQAVGRWVGAYSLGGTTTYGKLGVFRAGRRFSGDVVGARGIISPLAGVSARRNRVNFRLGRLRFAGSVR